MQPDYSQFSSFAIAALAVFIIYRRFRRLFGRQLLSPARMRLRIGILLIVGCALIPAALQSSQIVAADIAGVAVGISLALWGARRTRFQTFGGRLHYIPHTYTGIAVSLLFIGRLVFRFVNFYGMGHAAAGAAGAPVGSFAPAENFAPSMMMGRSPLTFGLLYVLVGYYVCYYTLVLRRSKHLGPEDIEAETSTAAPP